jgi:hypothetical protein
MTFWVQGREGVSLRAERLLDSQEILWSMLSMWVPCSLHFLLSKVKHCLDFPLCSTGKIEHVETVQLHGSKLRNLKKQYRASKSDTTNSF